jgi:hypothetical protein
MHSGPKLNGIYVTTLPHNRAHEVFFLNKKGGMLIGRCDARRVDSIDWYRQTKLIFSTPTVYTNWQFENGFLRFSVPNPNGLSSCLGKIEGARLELSIFNHISGRNYFKKYDFVPLPENLEELFAKANSQSSFPASTAKPHIDGQPAWPPPFPLLAHLQRNKTVRLAVEWADEERAIKVGEYEWITIAQGFEWSIQGGAYNYEGVRYRPTWWFNFEAPGSLRVSYLSANGEDEGDGFDGEIVDALTKSPE